MMHLFFELIQIALANRNSFNRPPSDIEWKSLYEMACKQSLAGVLLDGVNRLIEIGNCSKPPMNVLYEWIGLQQHTVAHNKLQNQRTKLIISGQNYKFFQQKYVHIPLFSCFCNRELANRV